MKRKECVEIFVDKLLKRQKDRSNDTKVKSSIFLDVTLRSRIGIYRCFKKRTASIFIAEEEAEQASSKNVFSYTTRRHIPEYIHSTSNSHYCENINSGNIRKV